MSAISNSLVVTRNPGVQSSPGSLVKGLQSSAPTKLSFSLDGPSKVQLTASRRSLIVRAAKRWCLLDPPETNDGGRPSSASIFVGGFVLGGLIVGALGCVYAPQISKALSGTDRKEIMRKLPKFIYDEEKALEKTRKVLTEKIAQLNSAIDDVSAQLRSEDAPNGVAVNSDEIEAAI